MPNLEDLILPAISCPIEIEKGKRGGIRLRLMRDLLEVEVRHANGDATYNTEKLCSREQVFINDPFFPYFGIVAANAGPIVNDIDISAIYVKNLDDRRYQDKTALEQTRLRYILKKHQAGASTDDEAPATAHDLLAAKL